MDIVEMDKLRRYLVSLVREGLRSGILIAGTNITYKEGNIIIPLNPRFDAAAQEVIEQRQATNA